jgi:ubiquinone/menaquinone biosynthesis C-methylase UbiE
MTGKEYFEHFNNWGNDLDEKEKERVIKTISLIPDDVDSVLDIGCGDGRITNKLTKFKKVVGLDFSKTALKYVRFDKIIASCTSIPFRSGSFNLLLLSEVLEHLDEKAYQETLKEIERIDKRYVVISVPYEQNLNAFLCKCANCGHTYLGSSSAGEHVRTFNNKNLELLFNKFSLRRKIYHGNTHSDPLLKVKHLLGYYYTNEWAVCSRCGSRRQTSRRKDFLYSIISYVSRVIGQKKPIWAMCLYERNEK